MSAQYAITSVSTETNKVLKVVDGTNNIIYSFPTGTGLVVENYSASAYDFIITHQNVGKLVIPVTAISILGGSAPNGSSYTTDFATFAGLLP
jgi:hypothetical protein